MLCLPFGDKITHTTGWFACVSCETEFSIFISVINQLDAQNSASGIITPIGVMIPEAV